MQEHTHCMPRNDLFRLSVRWPVLWDVQPSGEVEYPESPRDTFLNVLKPFKMFLCI